jgi:hypothetical protein
MSANEKYRMKKKIKLNAKGKEDGKSSFKK